MQPTEASTGPAPDLSNARLSAFERTAAARAALDPQNLVPYTLDAVYASAVASATAVRIRPFRDSISKLPGFDMRNVDCLEDYANALLHAHTLIVARANRVNLLPVHAAEGTKIRQIFFSYADLLVLKEIFKAEVIAKLKEGTGYEDLIEDLSTLVVLYRAHPEITRDGAPVTKAEVDRASELAQLMKLELGGRNDPDGEVTALLGDRQRAGTLLLRAYQQVRRALDYLRFDEGDAAVLAPPIHVLGSRTPSKDAAPAEKDPVNVVIPAPAKPVSTGPVVGGGGNPFVRPTP